MIIVDIEASGPVSQIHSIASIGAINFEQPTEQFYKECKVYVGSQINMGSIAYAGFTIEQLTDPHKPSVDSIVAEFFHWAIDRGGLFLAGHNVSFDISFLRDSAIRFSLEWPFSYRSLDLHSIAYYHHMKRGITINDNHGNSVLSLDTILSYVGLPQEPKPHNALNGAKLEAEAFARILHKRNLLDEFREYPIPDYL